MDAAYWHRRWSDGKIGFHEGVPNRWLEEHVGLLGPGSGRRVLVPLCGKTIDLAFLAVQGFEVVGVELSMDAAKAFFDEAGLDVTRSEANGYEQLSAGAIAIWVGDFFDLRDAHGTFDAFYDRAACIALPSDMRTRYARTVIERLTTEARGLVVTLEHDAPDGPPFSVTEAELARIWPELDRAPLGSVDAMDEGSGLASRGATFVREHAYAVRR